jgi:hypothetical protein
MSRPLMTLALIAATMIATAAGVLGKECKCRYYERRIEVGAVACIRGRLAQCVMFQNNPSWKFISDTCPVSRRDGKPQKLQTKVKLAAG